MSARSAAEFGQLFLLKLEGAGRTRGLEGLLRAFQPAGIVVPGPRIRTESKLAELSVRAREAQKGLPLIALAGDKSQPDPLRNVFPALADFPHPEEAGRAGSKSAGALGRLRGALLRMLGANIDLAFSLDLAPLRAESALAPGPFGTDAQVVAKCGAAYLDGLERQGLLACAGHFPGLGSVMADPSTGTWISGKPMAALWREDLLPYRELLPKLPVILISRAAYKAYDLDLPRPAMFSTEVVTGLLRIKLGYKSVSIADVTDLKSAAMEPGGAAVKAIEAGCDLVIVRASRVVMESALRAIESACESGRISAGRLRDSLERIRSMKKAIPLLPRRPVSAGALGRHMKQVRKLLAEFKEQNNSCQP